MGSDPWGVRMVASQPLIGMARGLREEVAGGIFHVYARGNKKADIFRDDADRQSYITLLGRVAGRCSWSCLAYCLMPNHVHLLVETPQPNLGRGMQWLQSRYALAFNRRHGRTGHLFEERYKSPKVTTDEAFI